MSPANDIFISKPGSMAEGVRFIKSIRVVNGATGEGHTHYLKCLKGWCISLNAISRLWSRLHGDFNTCFW